MKIDILGKTVDIDPLYGRELTEQYEKFINSLVYCISVLSRHTYFSERLWMNLEGSEYIDEVELHMAFLAKCLYCHGIYLIAVGSTFTTTLDEKRSNSFINQFRSIWRDYGKWCEKQR